VGVRFIRTGNSRPLVARDTPPSPPLGRPLSTCGVWVRGAEAHRLARCAPSLRGGALCACLPCAGEWGLWDRAVPSADDGAPLCVRFTGTGNSRPMVARDMPALSPTGGALCRRAAFGSGVGRLIGWLGAPPPCEGAHFLYARPPGPVCACGPRRRGVRAIGAPGAPLMRRGRTLFTGGAMTPLRGA